MTTDRIKAALTIGLRGKGLDGLTEATEALIREAVERESARWVEALTSDEVVELASRAVLKRPGDWPRFSEAIRAEVLDATSKQFQAAADTIRGQE